jgi:hypothetical protein
MQIRSKFVVSVVSLLGVVACGEDDGGSTGGVSSSKKIGELNESEAKEFCRSAASKLNRFLTANLDLVCIGFGVGLGDGDKEVCEEQVEECEAENDGTFEVDCDTATVTEDGDCEDVTVGELNACLEANAKAVEAVKAKVSCSTDIDGLDEIQSDYEQPKACKDISDRCSLADMSLEP